MSQAGSKSVTYYLRWPLTSFIVHFRHKTFYPPLHWGIKVILECLSIIHSTDLVNAAVSNIWYTKSYFLTVTSLFNCCEAM